MLEDVLWVEKYRPKVIAETILPTDLKKTFQTFVDQKMVPNLLLSGPPGIGKTTVAKAMLDELGVDYYIINGSLHGNIDVLRNEIMSYASTVSLTGGRKYVIIDEADYLSAATQAALRNFMEEFSRNCGFIMTCNFKDRILDALRSRCSVVEFKVTKGDKPMLAMEFMKRLDRILKAENVDSDKKVLAELIMLHFPDWRRVLNECQRYAATGKIDSGILKTFTDESLGMLVKYLKTKSFSEMRKWVTDSSDVDPTSIMRRLYDNAVDILKPSSIPSLVLILAEYQYKAAFVADTELNLVACLTQIMVEVEWL